MTSVADDHLEESHAEQVDVEPESEPGVTVPLATRPETGDEQVDAALERLEQAQGGALQDHLAAAESIHQVLQRRLSAVHE